MWPSWSIFTDRACSPYRSSGSTSSPPCAPSRFWLPLVNLWLQCGRLAWICLNYVPTNHCKNCVCMPSLPFKHVWNIQILSEELHLLLFFCAATSVDKGDCMGGSTLSLLHDRTFNYTGDSQAQELCLYLTKAASVPYFEMLEKWIYRGIIKDPYGYGNEKQQLAWIT